MIELNNVSKSYQSGEIVVHALKNISLRIDAGERVALAGASGSGKTTILNLVGCMDYVDGGLISIKDVDITQLNEDEKTVYRRDNLGFIFQQYNLIPVLTAYENISFALDLMGLEQEEIRHRTNEILKEVGLEDKGDRLPTQLSGGQQQRVAIARALVKEPRIILADEPTANLDSTTGNEILELISRLNEKFGTTVLIATHDDNVMKYAKRLIRIADGLVATDDIQ